MSDMNMATLIIIIANVAFSIKGFNDFSFFEKYKFNIAGIRRGDQIRMFTSGFLHVDFTHLLFNMLTLYFFAGVVIGAVGVFKFVMIYLASLLIGNVLSLYFHKEVAGRFWDRHCDFPSFDIRRPASVQGYKNIGAI